jgi:hypothetical protein
MKSDSCAGGFRFVGVGQTVEGMRIHALGAILRKILHMTLFLSLALAANSAAQAPAPPQKQVWKPVLFAIIKYNDEAPKSWNLYHTDKKGVLLLHLWKRYLLVNMKEEEVYDIDPATVKEAGDNIEWSLADKPSDPIETGEWKTRDIGPTQRVRFRLGKNGNVVEMQIPLQVNGKPLY